MAKATLKRCGRFATLNAPWDTWVTPATLPMLACIWRRTIRNTSRASNWSLTVGFRLSSIKIPTGLPNIGLGETAMVHADDVRASIKVCMFDQYGTVVDMQTGLTEAAAPYLAANGWRGNPNSFVTWWRRTHFENSMIDALLHREHTSYREIGQRSVAFVLERAGIPYTLGEVRDLVAHIERLRPFPEVPEALARLQTRYPLVVLSNGDPDMLQT